MQKNKKPAPDLLRRLEEADQAVSNEKKKISEYQAEMAQIDSRFDATLKRYRELTPNQATK
jgi:hypothetical protein